MARWRTPPAAQGALDLVGASESSEAERPALSVAELYDEVDGVLARAFPRSRMLWVRGEIQHFSDRTGHCYLDLIDPEQRRGHQVPVLRVKCWRTSWSRVKAMLRRQGLTLEEGMVVLLRGSLDLYRPRAELSFIMADLDVTMLLGQQAAKRAALLQALHTEGLFDRNKSLRLAQVPIRVGVVASQGTEGYRDLMGQLSGSGWGFQVYLAPASVQGSGAPASIVRGLRMMHGLQPDIVLLVRGGGSKADLAAFDHERVARAVATMPVPVWTGIGHSGDESVTDLVAHRAHSTPTACAKELNDRVATWWEERLLPAVASITGSSNRVVRELEQRSAACRTHLTGATRHQLRWHTESLESRSMRIAKSSPLLVPAAARDNEGRAQRLSELSSEQLRQHGEQLVTWRRLLAAYDVQRQLERGYSLTTDEGGRVVRSVQPLHLGQLLTTRLADGTARSRIVEEEPEPAASRHEVGDHSS